VLEQSRTNVQNDLKDHIPCVVGWQIRLPVPQQNLATIDRRGSTEEKYTLSMGKRMARFFVRYQISWWTNTLFEAEHTGLEGGYSPKDDSE